MNYSEMSDSQINIAVAHALGAKVETSSNLTAFYKPDFEVSELSPGGPVDKFAPCNSWADAGPIIEKENISLTCHHSREEWAAIFNRHSMSANKNPLRAAMECFLMKKERENAA